MQHLKYPIKHVVHFSLPRVKGAGKTGGKELSLDFPLI